MSGRGDNNKHGSSGQGASNQSNEGFIADDEKQPKSNHNKGDKVTGGEPLQPRKLQQKIRTQTATTARKVKIEKTISGDWNCED